MLRKSLERLACIWDEEYPENILAEVRSTLSSTQTTAEGYERECAASVFANVIKFGASEREARLVFANMQDRDNFLALLVAAEQLRAQSAQKKGGE